RYGVGEETDSAPGFLDSSIILLMSAALVLFLLWTTSRTIGVDSFENLPSWLSRSSNAIWTSFVSGSLGISCVAAAVVFFSKKNGTAGTMLLAAGMILVLISQGLQVGPWVIKLVQPSQVLPPQALVEDQQAATKELSDQIEQSHGSPLDRSDVERGVAHLINTFAGEGYLALTPPRNDIDLGTVLIKQGGRLMEVARGADMFGEVPTETASAPAIHYETDGVVLDCAPIVNYAQISSLKSPARADFLERLAETEHGSELFVVAGTIGCRDLKVNGVDLGGKLTLAVKLAKLSPGK